MKKHLGDKPEGASKYAQKLQAKRGRGKADPSWQWWFEGGTPRSSMLLANAREIAEWRAQRAIEVAQ